MRTESLAQQWKYVHRGGMNCKFERGGDMSASHISFQQPANFGTTSLPANSLDEARMTRVAAKLVRLAPKPGAVVYVDVSPLPVLLSGSRAFVFSAFDACTHLQVARIYLTDSLTSVADFTGFIQVKFPFSISRIRTATMEPFWIEPLTATVQRFTNHLAAQGILHVLVSDRSQDDLFSLFDHLTFVHQAGSSHRPPVISQLVGELIAFLYFHNNNRTMVSLNGKTPVEKLKSFSGNEEISSFDPFSSEPLRFESHVRPSRESQNALAGISA